MNDTVIAIDIAKAVFELAVSRLPGRVDDRKRLSRAQLVPYLTTLAPAIIVMEACGSAHHWAREFQRLGHQVLLLPPHLVRPYVRRNKTDRADAKGLLEAYRNREIKPVPVKTPEQQMVGALHRLRSGWVRDRTARLNALRGLCREVGVFIPLGADRVVPEVRAFIGDAEQEVPRPLRAALSAACDEIAQIEERIELVRKELEALARQLPVVDMLMTVPGMGLMTATAVFAFVGDLRRFPTARHLSSFLGLTPRESSSGLYRNLGRITKRGDVYLRHLLIHGARAALAGAKRSPQHDHLRTWALELEKRVGHNKATVGLANKIARIAWAVATRGKPFKSVAAPATTSAA